MGQRSNHDGPPDELLEDLEVAPSEWDAREVYFLMTGLVVPRPVAWVSTVAEDGTRNLAPHSFFNVVSYSPPHVVIGSVGSKDTLRNVRATGELVVNLSTEHVLEEMNATAVDAPPGTDEFDLVGIEAAPSAVVAPPRVAAAVAHLECRLGRVEPVGDSFLVIAEVVHVHVRRDVWDAGRVDPARLRPVLRLAGTQYASLGELYRLHRPGWAEVPADHADRSWIPRR